MVCLKLSFVGTFSDIVCICGALANSIDSVCCRLGQFSWLAISKMQCQRVLIQFRVQNSLFDQKFSSERKNLKPCGTDVLGNIYVCPSKSDWID